MNAAGGQTERTVTVRVLVVDDEPAVANLVATYLERADDRVAVTTITDPEAGLDEARTGDYDCVVSDYHMPGTDGLSLLERVAADAPETERILHTTDDSSSVRRAAEDADVDFVHKHMYGDQYERMAAQICERART